MRNEMPNFIEQYDDHRKPKKSESPIAARAWEYLTFKNLIHAGSVIEGKDVENALGKKYEENSWSFLGPFLLLKAKIETEGYFVTQRDCETPGFRILSSEEMAEHAYRKLMHNLASNYKIAYTMAAHDTSKMSENTKKKHKCVQNQAAQTALLQQKMLIDSNYF
jgi:hypothetical protein